MASAVPRSSRFSRPWSRGSARAATYRLHVLIGFVLSLVAVTVAFRVPWGGGERVVGWGTPPTEAFHVMFEETGSQQPEQVTGLVSQHRDESTAGDTQARAEEEEGPSEQPAATAAQADARAPLPELNKLAPILEFAEVAPTLVGGLGNLYLHIRYPQAAIDQGIQGQLILRFVVEPDGRTTNIVVEKSLHPLCDSAAVQALREVAFRPGRQDGEAARVRMRLPVRFRIVDSGGEPLPDSTLAAGGQGR